MGFQDEQDDVVFTEPVQAKVDVKMKVFFVETSKWVAKPEAKEFAGLEYKALKVTYKIDDKNVVKEHEDSITKLVEDQINLEKYPFADKETGTVRFMGRNKLYQLERALGFDPWFVDAQGNPIPPIVTKAGNKRGPKGAKQMINPDFFQAYFNPDGTPKVDNWLEKVVYADLTLRKSEQYGDKNEVKKYKPVPDTVS